MEFYSLSVDNIPYVILHVADTSFVCMVIISFSELLGEFFHISLHKCCVLILLLPSVS